MKQMINKVVFPVAGLGTRFLPATKANAKEMLPVVDKPLIQYAVEEAVEAGCDTMVFITGGNKRSIADHFDKATELEKELAMKGKDDLLGQLQAIIPPHVNCVYIRQPEALGLGHAILCAEPVVNDEPFGVILADDLIYSPRQGCLGQMHDIYQEYGCSVIGVQDVKREDTDKYGVVDAAPMHDKLMDIAGIVEKPKPAEAPSTCAVVGRYILNPRIFELLKDTKPGAGNEIQLTDAIARLLSYERALAYEFEGKRFDCGSKLGYLMANVDYGLSHPDFGEAFSEYLQERLS